MVDEKGKINRFCYKNSGWRSSSATNDAYYSKYVSGDGDIYNHRYGGHVCPAVPCQLGCTGEKTGLAEYVRSGGQMPLLYLKTWRKKPAIENLINAGWTKLVSAKLDKESDPYEINEGVLKGIDCTKARPHEMLGMDKASFKILRKSNPEGWSMMYDVVQTRVNEILAERHEEKITALAWETIRGDHGDGKKREEALGDLYDEVQDKVNELLKIHYGG